MYTKLQWQWIWERYCQGYTYKELGEFLGLHPGSVRRRFVRLGLRPEARENLEPLEERRREFCRLEEDLWV